MIILVATKQRAILVRWGEASWDSDSQEPEYGERWWDRRVGGTGGRKSVILDDMYDCFFC